MSTSQSSIDQPTNTMTEFLVTGLKVGHRVNLVELSGINTALKNYLHILWFRAQGSKHHMTEPKTMIKM